MISDKNVCTVKKRKKNCIHIQITKKNNQILFLSTMNIQKFKSFCCIHKCLKKIHSQFNSIL